ncbi:MAG: hypothetical protein ACREJ2_11625 [Planctomycetota bacterium]
MRLERKRSKQSSPSLIGQGKLTEHTFDGYELMLRAIDGQGRELRVRLERHDAERIARFVLAELAEQRRRVASAVKTADSLF